MTPSPSRSLRMSDSDTLLLDPRMKMLLANYPPALFPVGLYRSIELLERYSQDLAIGLLDQLDVPARLKTWQTVGALIQRLGYTAQFATPLAWLLERLVESEAIEKEVRGTERHYRLRRELWQPELESLRASVLAIDPANAAALDLMDRAAMVYPAVARGEVSGEQALFGAGEIGLWLVYFDNGNPTYAINNSLAAHAIAGRLPDKSRIRILELGAGAGSAAEALLNVLIEQGLSDRLERYVITEPNTFFRRRAERHLKKHFGHLPLSFAGLDIDRDWCEQGFAGESYDLIFGVNVFHVAHDLSFSLDQARRRLVPGGWLVVGECLRPSPWQPIFPEFMFQILDGFMRVKLEPETRPNPGFLTAAQWRQAFARAGFGHSEVAPDVERIHEMYPYFFTGAICGR